MWTWGGLDKITLCPCSRPDVVANWVTAQHWARKAWGQSPHCPCVTWSALDLNQDVMPGLLLHGPIKLCLLYSWRSKTIHVVNLCNSLAEWKHAMIVSHYINIILILLSWLILSLNIVTQMWKIILKYPGTFQYTFCRAHYETPKNWRNFIISYCPGGCKSAVSSTVSSSKQQMKYQNPTILWERKSSGDRCFVEVW